MFLPLMPTTVFLLMAAYCYSRSSDKFHTWLMTNRLFGRYISDYKGKRGMSVRHKVTTLLTLWISIGVSIWLMGGGLWSTLILTAIAVAITVHILWIKTYRPEAAETSAVPAETA